MQARFLVGLILCGPAFGSIAAAREPYREFLEGLRERQYIDLAEAYLQQIEQDPSTPEEIRKVLPYETAVTLLAGSRLERNPDARERRLDEAQAHFEKFVSASPDHPLAAQANTERAHILLDKARVEVWKADAPSNEGNREALRQRARDLIDLARDVFQKAHDQHQAGWEKVKGFIPEDEEARRTERATVEGLYMQAQVDLARCTYELAQTYDAGSGRRNELLNEAAAQFEAIHHKYRSQIAGLHARMWQGKCFEEQDDVRKALGIYNEILNHPGDQLRSLQDRVRWFRLICLNHDSRKDYQLVIDEATAWRKESRDKLRTTVGLGILYELARAQQAMAMGDREMTEILKADLLKQALENAQIVARYPGPLKAPAAALAQRLMASLNREAGDPQDFDTAFGAASIRLEEAIQLNRRIDESQGSGHAEELSTLVKMRQAASGEIIRLYDLALRLATPRTDPEQINLARFRLAFAYYLHEDYLEAGVLGRYVAQRSAQQSPQIALESAYIALAAFDRLFSTADEADREFEMQQVMDTARFLAEHWPESDRAVEAGTVVARLYRQLDQPLLAAEWYAQVPSTAGKYAEAQLSAGQSYWNAYLTRAALAADQRPPAETLAEWLQKAEEHLSTGVERRERQLPADSPTPDDLVLGKLSLVQIRNRQGVYTDADGRRGAIELLTEPPHPVLLAVAAPDGEPRPTTPGAVRSQAIASLAWQQLLRAQIGIRDLEGARETRQTLESIAGEGSDSAALTQVYVEFGRELERELEQLQSSGETARLNEVRSAFESFLDDLFARKEGQTFNSLLWIAETYTGLAEGSSTDAEKSAEYFERAAAAYDDILRRAAAETDFVPSAGQLIAVRLRLMNCRRQQGHFAAAEDILRDVLRERPEALDAQFEAARLYEQWAATGGPDAATRWSLAIQGERNEGPVWGWAAIAKRLQRALDSGQSSQEYREKHIDARYHLAHCQFELADEQTTSETQLEHLNAARFGILRFLAITDRLPETDWQRFNGLYQRILAALGEPSAPLPRRGEVSDPAAQDVEPATTPAALDRAPRNAGTTATGGGNSPTGSGNKLVLGLLIAAGMGLIGSIYAITVVQDRRRRAKYRYHAGASRNVTPGSKKASRTDP